MPGVKKLSFVPYGTLKYSMLPEQCVKAPSLLRSLNGGVLNRTLALKSNNLKDRSDKVLAASLLRWNFILILNIAFPVSRMIMRRNSVL
jgi:hypothetical protein